MAEMWYTLSNSSINSNSNILLSLLDIVTVVHGRALWAPEDQPHRTLVEVAKFGEGKIFDLLGGCEIWVNAHDRADIAQSDIGIKCDLKASVS